jgi:Mg2+ and Co2+ transporter CorA
MQLKDLLGLKQQQASIIEAKHALKRADLSVIQGRSMMLFTIVTIIFLPLSFMTSVFGMNASDFDAPSGDGSKMTLRHQFKLLCELSIPLRRPNPTFSAN